MTSRYEETLVVDTRQALAALQRLERSAKDALTVDVDIDEGAARLLANELATAARHSTDLDRNSRDIEASLRQAELGASRLTTEVARAELAAGRSEANFRQIATSLGIAEGEAADMAREVLEAQVQATRLEENIRDVARQMGLSGKEADSFERSMRAAARAQDSMGTGAATLNQRMTNLRSTLVGVGAVVGTIGFAGLARGINAALGAASDLAESTSKATVVFGASLDSVRQQLGDTASTVLLSNQAALEATATFGNLFTALGLSQREAATLSPAIVQLAADLASFNNARVDDVIVSLRAGLVGEVEPLRRLGVSINAATVEAKAMALGLVDVNGEVTEAGKVQARYALILEQTRNAQGDVARTLDGYANTSRRAGAEVGDFAAELGEVLLPAAQAFQALVPQMIDGLRQLIPAFAATADSAASFFNELGAVDEAGGGFGFRQFGAEARVFGGTLGDVGGAIGDFFTVIGAKVAVQTEAADRAMQRLGQRGARFELRDLGVRLASELDAGRSAVDAFSDAVLRLGEGKEDIETFRQGLGDFAIQSGLTAEELIPVIQNIIDLGLAGDLSEDELSALAVVLAGLQNTVAPVGNEAAQAARSFNDMSNSAVQAAPRFTTLKTAVDEVGAALPTLAGAVEAAGAAIGDNLDPFAQASERLKVSGKQFLQNLRDQVTATAKFEADVARLVALGFGRVAAELLEQGPAAAQAARDLVNNTTRAAEAEQLLAGVGTAAAQQVGAELTTELRSTGLTAEARQSFIDLADEFDSPQVAGAFVEAGRGAARSVGSGFGPQMFVEGEEAGGDFNAGLLSGIQGLSAAQIAASVTSVLVSSVSLANAYEAGAKTAQSFESGLRGPRGLQESSPSKLMMGIGREAIEAFILGIEQGLVGGVDVRLPITGGIESQLSAADLAASVTDRLVSSVSLAQARTAGEEIAAALEGGIRDGLEMSSPSRLMQRIAEQAVADFLAATQSSLSAGINLDVPISGSLSGSLNGAVAASAGGPLVEQHFHGESITKDAVKGAQIAGTIISLLPQVRGPGTGTRI